MRTSIRKALIITRREVRDQFRDWRIIFPIIILTLFFPALMNFTASQAVGFVEKYSAPIVGERLIPFLLMIVGFFPISVSLVIALESFVGEKERRSIEPLLSSPLSDNQLYFGKLLAAMVYPLMASYLGILVYLIGVYIQVGWKPEPILLIQILLLTTVQAVVMVSGAVVVSSQTTSVRAANLLASFIIIPMALLIQGESIVMFWARYNVLWWTIAGLILIAGLLIRTGIAHFNREELLGRELDMLNLYWAFRVFKETFSGGRRSLFAWYRHEVLAELSKLGKPILFTSLAMIIGIIMGLIEANEFILPAEILSLNNLDKGFIEGLEAIRFFSPTGVGIVWLHNLRVIALATLVGIFSFGVLGLIVMMLPIAVISYVAANVSQAGYSPLAFLTALVLPHGLFEIPAMILTGAIILNLGATLATPAESQTIGEAWLRSLARWAKVLVGVILPLFLVAAIVEVYITPYIAILILGR